MLGQIIIDDKCVLALLHEVFAHGAAGVGGDILQCGKLARGGAYHYGVVHSSCLGKGFHHLNNGGVLLTDGNVNADAVLALLVDYGIRRYCGLTGLPVAYYKLTLTSSDGYHGIYRLDACLQRDAYRLSFDDACSLLLDGKHLIALNGSLAVDRLTESIYYPADKPIPYRDGHNCTGALDGIPLTHTLVGAKHNYRNKILFQVERHAVGSVGELHQLIGKAVVKSVDRRYTVADGDNASGFGKLRFSFVILYLSLYKAADFV